MLAQSLAERRVCVPRRKKAVEMELAKCKIDIMSLNSQLLDAIQQKLNLSQQLEAWQVGQRSRVTFKWNPQLKSRICFLLLFF